ncbi:chorismate synthase [Achromobacter insuavis]
MPGNTLGTLFTVTNFGESHGPAIGCVIDGCPPGLPLEAADIQHELDRRRPGTSRHVTQRQEADQVEILSGVYEGLTTGTPIGLLIRNTDARSKDYSNIADTFRPGHADYAYWRKFGLRDPRGGGRSSARLTAPTAAGAVAKKWLAEQYGVKVRGYMSQLARSRFPLSRGTRCRTTRSTRRMPTSCPNWKPTWTSCAAMATRSARASRWWPRTCRPAGAAIYDRLDADIAHVMMGLNAVKGVSIGAGFDCIAQRGSEHGDELTPDGFLTNHAGGVLGGISTGQPVTVSLAIKPTSSIRVERRSVNRANEPVMVQTLGRHDPCVGIRATPIAEAMLALVLIDHALRHRGQCGDQG